MEGSTIMLLSLLMLSGLILLMFFVLDLDLELVVDKDDTSTSDTHHHNASYDVKGGLSSHNISSLAHSSKLNVSAFDAHNTSTSAHSSMFGSKLDTSVFNAHNTSTSAHSSMFGSKLDTSVFNTYKSGEGAYIKSGDYGGNGPKGDDITPDFAGQMYFDTDSGNDGTGKGAYVALNTSTSNFAKLDTSTVS